MPPFGDRKDKWSSYLIRVEAFFEGNSIKEDAKKRALLISTLGSRTIEVLCGVCAPKGVNKLVYTNTNTNTNTNTRNVYMVVREVHSYVDREHYPEAGRALPGVLFVQRHFRYHQTTNVV